MALTGSEVLQVQGFDGAGNASGETFNTTTGAIASLAAFGSSSNIITPLNTVGAGTITAAGIIGRITQRGGAQSGTAFTDTTATAAAIFALLPSGDPVGTSFQYSYENLTNAVATLTGGTGVTISGIATIPANAYVRFLLTYTAAATMTMVGFETGGFAADATDSTKVIGFKPSGQTTATTALIASVNTANATYTLPAATDTLAGIAAAQTLTNKTLTAPTINGVVGGTTTSQTITTLTATTVNGNTITTGTGTLTLAAAITATGPATSGTLALIATPPQAGGATLAVTGAMSGKVIKLDTAAGTVATLPAATGSGNVYEFVVTTTTTSGAHKILANSVSDFINGIAMGFTGSTAKVFASAAATNHSIQMPFAGTQPSGGFIGDYFTFTDVAANLWQCNSMYQAGVTPTTPFSSATS